MSAGASVTAVGVDPVTAVTLPVPAGVLPGDVLVAQVTADNNPTMATVPPGWTPVLAQLNVTTGARVFVYYRVVVAGEPVSHAFALSAPQRWGAVVGSFRGVDTVDPFETPATTRTDLTYTARTLVVPEVVTTTPGAMLVGGVGFDNRTVAVTPPARLDRDRGEHQRAGRPAVRPGPPGRRRHRDRDVVVQHGRRRRRLAARPAPGPGAVVTRRCFVGSGGRR